MRRATRQALAGGLLALWAVVSLAPAASASARRDEAGQRADSSTGRVLIIAAPRLTWAQVDEIRPHYLTQLFERSAVALCSTRTAGSLTRPGDAYLTIGAGNRMGTVIDVDGSVVDRTEPILEGDPTAVYQRTTGKTPTRPILAMGKPAIDH